MPTIEQLQKKIRMQELVVAAREKKLKDDEEKIKLQRRLTELKKTNLRRASSTILGVKKERFRRFGRGAGRVSKAVGRGTVVVGKKAFKKTLKFLDNVAEAEMRQRRLETQRRKPVRRKPIKRKPSRKKRR